MKHIFSFVLLFVAQQVLAQDNFEPPLIQGLQIEQERAQLDEMRKQASAQFSAAKKVCYQKIAVTACIDRAKKVKNEQDNEHKRLSLVLNDAQRKQRGINALNRTDEKQSPEKQAEREEQRADRLKQQDEALERNLEKNEKQQEKIDGIQKNRDERAKHVQEVLDRQQKHKDKLNEAQQSRSNYQRKLDQAEQHREQVKKENASRKSPEAPLPPLSTPSP